MSETIKEREPAVVHLIWYSTSMLLTVVLSLTTIGINHWLGEGLYVFNFMWLIVGICLFKTLKHATLFLWELYKCCTN